MAVLELAVLIKVTKRLFCFLICWIISKLVIIPTMIRVLPIFVELLFLLVVLFLKQILLTLSIWIFIFHRLIFSKNFFTFVLFICFFCFLFSVG